MTSSITVDPRTPRKGCRKLGDDIIGNSLLLLVIKDCDGDERRHIGGNPCSQRPRVRTF
jgi:hypothetical protein